MTSDEMIFDLEACADELEPFVDADKASQFLSVTRRHLLEMARRGLHGAYPMGTGTERKIWVFRLSELAQTVIEGQAYNRPGSPR